MIDEILLEPLEFAVLNIISNSHLTNSNYTYIPIRDLHRVGFIENPVFPFITAQSMLTRMTEDEIFAELVIAIVIPFPELYPGESELSLHARIISEASSRQRDLIEIQQWLSGRLKVNGIPLYDYSFSGGELFIDYDPSTTDDNEKEKQLRINKVVNVMATFEFQGDYETLCCERFSPGPALQGWFNILND